MGLITSETFPTSHSTTPSHQDISTVTDTNANQSLLLNAARSKAASLKPGDIRRVLSDSLSSKDSTSNKLKITMHIMYRVSQQVHHPSIGALVDRGANGGIAGNDVRIISKTDRTVDVSGIDNHEMNNLPIVTVGGTVCTQRGEVIVILNQMARVPNGKTILSSIQMESFGINIDDRSMKLHVVLQCLTSPE